MLDDANSVNPNCIDCPLDQFCWDNAIEKTDIDNSAFTTAGLCPSGYKCSSGANIEFPNHYYADNNNHYLCREGYYCDNTNSTIEV